MSETQVVTAAPANTARQVLFASMIGTTIEFFDFYIYATAAVLVFPGLFFPKSDPASATLASLATFGIAFLARPVGSAIFGHFGDRIGRKATLVAALLTMGLSTVAIGVLPTYRTIGFAAPLLLALCRFGQGLGLGGEWGGAVLLAVENAPPGKRAWYGMFPQLGAPLGFFLSGGVFLFLSRWLTDEQFFAFGWRLPFLVSAVLVFVGLYVRLAITETPVFQEVLNRREQVKVPMVVVFRDHTRTLLAGILVCLATFVLFYLMTVFALTWGTSALGFGREKFLLMQLFDIVFFALTIPLSAILAERGRRSTMLWVTGVDRRLRLGDGADVRRRHHRRGGDDGDGPIADGPHLRTAWHRALRTFSHGGALHGQLAGLQLRRHFGRFGGALYRHVARQELRTAIRRLLPLRSGRSDFCRIACRARNEGRRLRQRLIASVSHVLRRAVEKTCGRATATGPFPGALKRSFSRINAGAPARKTKAVRMREFQIPEGDF